MGGQELVWESNEPYRLAIARAQQLANSSGQSVHLLDADSGRTVQIVPPLRGLYDAAH